MSFRRHSGEEVDHERVNGNEDTPVNIDFRNVTVSLLLGLLALPAQARVQTEPPAQPSEQLPPQASEQAEEARKKEEEKKKKKKQQEQQEEEQKQQQQLTPEEKEQKAREQQRLEERQQQERERLGHGTGGDEL